MTKVLYVEDEPFLGKIVKESLESRQFNVSMVMDGKDAIRIFHDFHPDICVLDVMLPNKDGFTIAKEIRERHPSMPIIFLTAKDQIEDLIEGFKSGGNDYIKKPFSIEELIIRINNLLALTGTQSPNLVMADEYQVGEYTFYPHLMELHHHKNIDKLTHKENKLLHLLVTGDRESVDRRLIMMELWGDDGFFNSRNLDVYIRKLRSLLAKDKKVKIITLKGVGYRFVC